ncbi:MAG: hypothetical protein M1825_001633 [Sarcosagium campestre]|nr:MAG: hypothetical protein M1825_001633 [Sarcosagium campestre]
MSASEAAMSPDMPSSLKSCSLEEKQARELKLRRKIDRRLLPMIMLMYLLNYVDRNIIQAAKLSGIEEDLDLTSVQFATAVSVFFAGYIVMQVPSNLLLHRIGKPALYLSSCMAIWGTTSTLTGVTKNFEGLIVCRFILGLVEAAYFPGCLYYLSAWYTRKELSLRTALLFSGLLISGAFSGLLSAGLTASLDYERGFRAWRWLFFVEGSVTVVIALMAFFVLPDLPHNTKWLSEDERQLAMWRMEEDSCDGGTQRAQGRRPTLEGLKMALVDVKFWLFTLYFFCILSSASFTNFFPPIVRTLGYSNITSLLLTTPPYTLGIICCYLNAWHADKTGERFLHVTMPLIVFIGASILAGTTTGRGPRYTAMILMVPGLASGEVVALAWISNCFPHPMSKRAAALGAVNAIASCAPIYASYMYPAHAAPQYSGAFFANASTAFVSICFATLLRVVLVRENKKLDKIEHAETSDDEKGSVSPGNSGWARDQQKAFRYLT